MMHTRHITTEGTILRFTTDRGVVLAVVSLLGDGDAELKVSEEQTAIAAYTRPQEGDSPEELRARNHFGAGRMLRMMRITKAAFPEVKNWVWGRVTGAQVN